MLRPRWRKVLSDLWDNKIRTLLVVASIAVGVFAIGVIAGTYVLLSEDLKQNYDSVNPANIEIVTDPFEPDFVRSIRRVAGVAEVEGRRAVTVRVQKGPTEWDTLTLVASEAFPTLRVNQLLPQQGTLAPADQTVVLERKTLALLGVAVGDSLTIELADGTLKTLPIVGTGLEPTLGYGGVLGDLKGYVTLDTLEWLHQPLLLNQLFITVSEGRTDKAHLEAVATLVKERLEQSGRQVYRMEVAYQHPLSSILEALLGVLGIIGVLIVFLSGSLIMNTMSALLGQHIRQIGVMKLIGARRTQIIAMYLVLILAFGVIALLVAIPLGTWGAYALTRFAADIINFQLRSFRVIPFALVLQISIALLVPPLAGLLPILRGSGITVQQALSNLGGNSERLPKGWLDRQVERIRWVSRLLLISIRNTFRRKGRLALTLFTLTLGGAIFIAVFNTQVALNQQVARGMRYFRADVNLDFAQPYRIDEVEHLARTVPGVTGVEAWALANADVVRSDNAAPLSVVIFGPPAASALVEPELLQGRWLQPGDQNAIAVNEAFWSEFPQLQIGDTLRLKVQGEEADWVVVGIFKYIGLDELIAYANYDYLAQVTRSGAAATTYRITTAEQTPAYQQQVSVALEQRFKEQDFKLNKVQTGQSLITSSANLLGILTAVLFIMALLTALVGSIGLAGTMSMNVMERTREIGVLRAIGAHNQVVMQLVMVEGVLIGLLSFILGALLSFPITVVLSNVISYAIFHSPTELALTPTGFGLWLVAVLLLSTIASALPARNASRLAIREVLAYE